MASACFRRCALSIPRRASPKATFSPTDIIGNSASCWNTILTGRRFGATPCMLRPPIWIAPPSGTVKPDPSVYVLMWVDHHDEAYRWAERKRLEVNPATGAVQVLDMTAVPAPGPAEPRRAA